MSFLHPKPLLIFYSVVYREHGSSLTCQPHCHQFGLGMSIGFSIGGHFLNARIKVSGGVNPASESILACMRDSHCGVTEPFLVHESSDEWYLFARWTEKEPSERGKIVIFVSMDGLQTFHQGQTVLQEQWGIGRPFVVTHGDWHYMVTNVEDVLEGPHVLWLYESAPGDWPFRWGRKRRILYEESLTGRPLNPVLYYHSNDSTWYLFVLDEGLGMEQLFFSDRLDAGFLLHPKSGQVAWPLHAGPLVVDEDDPNKSIWAFLNLKDVSTGRNTVAARQIVTLSREDFQYSSTTVLIASDGQTEEDWNLEQYREKTFSACRVGVRQWIVASDHWQALQVTGKADECRQTSCTDNETQTVASRNTAVNKAYFSIKFCKDDSYPRPTVLPFGIYKSLYINLEHRTDRRSMIERVLGFSKIPFERVEAVDGRAGDNSHLVSGCYDNRYCPGHVGSQHSHIKAINYAIESDLDYVAIFEDDFMFNPLVDPGWIHVAVQRVMDLVPDWEVIGLLHNINQKEPLGDYQVKWSESFSSKIVRVIEAATATGYIARRSILPKLLETFHPTKCPVTSDRSVAIDQCWKSLQQQAKWIGFDPQVCDPKVWSIDQRNILHLDLLPKHD